MYTHLFKVCNRELCTINKVFVLLLFLFRYRTGTLQPQRETASPAGFGRRPLKLLRRLVRQLYQ